MPYISLFDRPIIITKKDLCELLNLDTTRPNLYFSASEIKKAYHKRALRFHSDKQNTFDQAIPEETCNILMNDIALARDYMLKGEHNIPGKAFVAAEVIQAKDWVDGAVSILNSLKEMPAFISAGVGAINRASNDWPLIILLSTYSAGQLNIRYLNHFKFLLDGVRPYLQGVDGSSVVALLRSIQDQAAEMDADEFIAQFKGLLQSSLTEHEHYEQLINALKETASEFKNMLSDDFIDQIEHILKFGFHLITHVPSWKHIMGVYFISLIATATTLPKFFNSIKVLTEVIYQHKGVLPLILLALPLTVLALTILPINLVAHLSIKLAWVGIESAFSIIANGLSLFSSTVQLLLSLNPKSDRSVALALVSVIESLFNLTARLVLNLLLETADVFIYIASSHSPLSSLINSMNQLFDTLFAKMKPGVRLAVNQEDALIVLDSAPAPAAQEPTRQPNFFDKQNLPLHNKDDLWLNQLFTDLELAPESEAEVASMSAA